MIDPITASIVIVLGKYALDKGGEFAKEVGPKALDTAKEMFTTALARLRRDPGGQAVADEYEADAATWEKPLEKKLDDAMQADDAFKTQLEALLAQFDNEAKTHAAATDSSYTAILKGDGAIAQGDGAIAVGKGGVNVGGNVTGNIVTGDKNKIEDKGD